MSRVRLVARTRPALRVDLRGIVPDRLAGLAAAEIERLGVVHGRETLPLAELFDVAFDGDAADELVLAGDLSRVDRIGWQLGAGRLRVEGPAGDFVGAGMTGGEIVIHGDAGVLAACEMAGGSLTVDGDVGDFAAAPLPGSLDGMRGGTFVVRGRAGERFADRMRRGTAVVFGDAGDFLASRLVAGTVAVCGRAGAHVGLGMRRGSVVFAGPPPTAVSPCFVPALVEPLVAWQLLARDLARHGGALAGLPSRRIDRRLGDVSADGRGELITLR